MVQKKDSSITHQQLRSVGMLVAVSAVLMIGAIAVASLAGGTIPKRSGSGYQNRIVEFELVLNKADVLNAIGDGVTEESKTVRAQIDRLNYADFLFMITYSIFSATLFIYFGALNIFRQRQRFSSNGFVRLGLILSLLMLLGDALENWRLLQLTGSFTPQSDPSLLPLIIFTRVKWAALFIASILLGMAWASYSGKSIKLLLGVIYCTAGATGLISIFLPDARPLCEVGMGAMGLGWLISAIHAGVTWLRIA